MSLANVGEAAVAALVGGAITGFGAYAIFDRKLAEAMTEIKNQKDSCTTCRNSVDKAIDILADSIKDHHEDSDKHVSSDSKTILGDILARVMRIEGKLFNGHRD